MEDNNKQLLRSAIAQFMVKSYKYHEPVGLALEINAATGEVRSMLNKMTKDGEIIELEGEYSYLNAKTDLSTPIARYVNSTLTEREKSEYALLKHNISKAFYIVGASLGRIRNLRLYREEYATFEEFCQIELGYTRRQVDRQILGAEIVEDLKMIATNSEYGNSKTPGSQTRTEVLPTAERQIRCLAKFPKQTRVEVWTKSVDRANGKVPTEKIVKQVAAEVVELEAEQSLRGFEVERFRRGDVVRIRTKGIPSLKEFDGTWGQVASIEQTSYTVLTWCGAVSQLRKSHLKEMPFDAGAAKEINRKLNCIRFKLKDERVFDSGTWAIIRTIGRMHESELNRRTNSLLDYLIKELSEDDY